MLSNRQIDNLIFSGGRWAIDQSFAFAEIHRYAAELDAKEAGATFEELGIKQRKAAMLPKLANADGLIAMKADAVGKYDLTSSDIPKGSFAVLNLFGAMRADGDWCSYGMRDFASWIDMANQNNRIKGILIQANSGGGETIAGQILRNAVSDSRKPIVVYADLLASAAVDGTLPAAEIIASGNSSQIGSIGVFCSINKKMVKYYQENVDDIYSSSSTKKNEAIRAYLKGDNSLILREVDKAASIFHAEVKNWRPQAAKHADVMEGDLFFAKDAKTRGLIDGIGTSRYALKRLIWHTSN